jgi:hexulose-6-phosphate isomerase
MHRGQRSRFSKEVFDMTHQHSRREFLAVSAAAGMGLVAAGFSHGMEYRTTLRKALIGKPDEATLRKFKEAGFEGMESSAWKVTPDEAAAARKTAEGLGMRIHSVLRGWTNFNHPEKETVDGDIASVETAILGAQAYGAEAVLLVPCRVGAKDMAIPEPWEFDIEFDEKTGHVSRVVKGDNAKYAKYIEAQSHATDTSREAVKRLIPVAEKAGVVIALENVWNSLWVMPELFRNFAASFDSPWVKVYFDIGNHVKYAPPHVWIQTLGRLIAKCHVKDFQLKPDGHGGKFMPVRDGSIDWPHVRRALDDIRYNGWLTIEGPAGDTLEEANRRLDLIIAGK